MIDSLFLYKVLRNIKNCAKFLQINLQNLFHLLTKFYKVLFKNPLHFLKDLSISTLSLSLCLPFKQANKHALKICMYHPAMQHVYCAAASVNLYSFIHPFHLPGTQAICEVCLLLGINFPALPSPFSTYVHKTCHILYTSIHPCTYIHISFNCTSYFHVCYIN